MGTIRLVAYRQATLDFAPTASTAVLGEKIGTNLWIGQPSCYGLGREPFFSGAVALLNSIDAYVKGCYALTSWDVYGRKAYADRVWKAYGVLIRFPLHDVYRFESLWLSDMSNCLFVAVNT
jgi:hypothetical protein